MDEPNNQQSGSELPDVSEHFGNETPMLPNVSETFPKESENPSETFGNAPHVSERTVHHTLPVRDVAKIFEGADFPVTERTVINWCNVNRRGIKRLDCFFDEQDGKYFITPHSVDAVLKEEAENVARDSSIYDKFSETFGKTETLLPNDSEGFGNSSEPLRKEGENASESFGNVRNMEEVARDYEPVAGGEEVMDRKRIKELEQELLDLKIMNKGKDYFIDQLKQDREAVVQERAQLISQLTASVKEIGVLETKLLQLEAPRGRIVDTEEGRAEGAQDYAP
jgi:hypothetical protein